jgi:hypothetical protein
MNYYKKLDIDYKLVASKTLEYVKLNRSSIKYFWTDFNFNDYSTHVPEIKSLFKNLNITPCRVSLITSSTSGNIHRDHTRSIARINIPILNCEESQTKFWKAIVDPTLIYEPNNVMYFKFEEKDCELADVLVLDKVTIIRVSEPHSVHVGNKVPRISLTIDFQENIENLLN